jgi:hypothetical protein
MSPPWPQLRVPAHRLQGSLTLGDAPSLRPSPAGVQADPQPIGIRLSHCQLRSGSSETRRSLKRMLRVLRYAGSRFEGTCLPVAAHVLGGAMLPSSVMNLRRFTANRARCSEPKRRLFSTRVQAVGCPNRAGADIVSLPRHVVWCQKKTKPSGLGPRLARHLAGAAVGWKSYAPMPSSGINDAGRLCSSLWCVIYCRKK